jgi:penicillin-binding protein-related factor A (putative recombinase)
MHQQAEYFNNYTLYPYCIYVFLFFWEQTATCAIYIKKLIVFITEMKSVYSAVRTGRLNKAACAPSFKG